MQKILLPTVCALALFYSCTPQMAEQPKAAGLYETITAQPAFDSTMAKKLEADPYGMHPYVMAFLKPGPNRKLDSLAAANLQMAHLKNIMRLAAEGKLVMAGPFLDNGPVAGIYIFNVKSVEEARELTATDPAIQAGRFEMELHPWYGSAALPLLNSLHKRVESKSVAD